MTVLFRAAHGINHSLWDLGLDYVDLMLIHQPGWNDEAVYWALEQAVRDGKVRSIGISNYYTPEAVKEILSFAKIMPAVIQNETICIIKTIRCRSMYFSCPNVGNLIKHE